MELINKIEKETKTNAKILIQNESKTGCMMQLKIIKSESKIHKLMVYLYQIELEEKLEAKSGESIQL